MRYALINTLIKIHELKGMNKKNKQLFLTHKFRTKEIKQYLNSLYSDKKLILEDQPMWSTAAGNQLKTINSPAEQFKYISAEFQRGDEIFHPYWQDLLDIAKIVQLYEPLRQLLVAQFCQIDTPELIAQLCLDVASKFNYREQWAIARLFCGEIEVRYKNSFTLKQNDYLANTLQIPGHIYDGRNIYLDDYLWIGYGANHDSQRGDLMIAVKDSNSIWSFYPSRNLVPVSSLRAAKRACSNWRGHKLKGELTHEDSIRLAQFLGLEIKDNWATLHPVRNKGFAVLT